MIRPRVRQCTWERLRPAGRCPSSRSLRLILALNLLGTLAWSQPLVIMHVTVIDATDHAAQPDMAVVIVGDRIAALSPSKTAKLPKNAQVVDGTGKFLIPGLWDVHVHGAADARAPWSYPLYLANGVVGVREMAGPSDAHAWRAQQASSAMPSPRIYLGSPIVDGPNPVWAGSIVAANEEQGREAVAEQQQRGADFIKVYERLPRGAYFAIADEARKRGIAFEGHVPDAVTAAEASDAGQKSIEHLTHVAEACSGEEKAILGEELSASERLRAPGLTIEERMTAGKRLIHSEARAYETYDEATAQSLFARFVRNGTWQCPTLTQVRSLMNDPQFLNVPWLKYLSKATRSHFSGGYYKNLPAEAQSALLELAKVRFRESMKLVGRMHRAGVHILAGTDAMNPRCFPGFSLHDELAMLAGAGLTPLAALQACTRNAAQFMGQLDRRGTIEAGKTADLVLLDKDPLADIHNTRSIEALVLHGKLMPRAALDAMLAEAQVLADSPQAGGPDTRN